MEEFVSLAMCVILILVGLILIAHFSPRVSRNPAFSVSGNQIHSTPSAPSNQESGNLPVMIGQQDNCLIYTYDGKIGVSKNKGKSPSEAIDVDVSSLPQTGQLLLATGIGADSVAGLQRVREDYESQIESPTVRDFPQKNLKPHTRLGMGLRYTTEVYLMFCS